MKKLTDRQWLMILIGALIILLLWWWYKRRQGMGSGSIDETGGDTAAGDATLPDPGENSRISSTASGYVPLLDRRKDTFI